MERPSTAPTTTPPAPPVAAVIADVEEALDAAMVPSAQSNAVGVAAMVRAALERHR